MQRDVVLECIKAPGVEVASVHRSLRCLVLPGTERSWNVGRQLQPELFTRLVPDEALLLCVSRAHLELTMDPGSDSVCLRRLTQNSILVNGTPAPIHAVPVPIGAHLGFCAPDSTDPFLVFLVLVCDATAIGITSAPVQQGSVSLPPTHGQGLVHLGATLKHGRQSGMQPHSAGQAPPHLPVTQASCSPVPRGVTMTCVFALGCSVELLPHDARMLDLGRIESGHWQGEALCVF